MCLAAVLVVERREAVRRTTFRLGDGHVRAVVLEAVQVRGEPRPEDEEAEQEQDADDRPHYGYTLGRAGIFVNHRRRKEQAYPRERAETVQLQWVDECPARCGMGVPHSGQRTGVARRSYPHRTHNPFACRRRRRMTFQATGIAAAAPTGSPIQIQDGRRGTTVATVSILVTSSWKRETMTPSYRVTQT